jgi:hypothetical protein
MSQELADLQPSEQTQATVTDSGAIEKAVPETTEQPDKFPEFKETSEKSVLRQQIEHAAKRGNPYKSADGKFTKKPLETKAPETAATEAKPESEVAKPEVSSQPQTVSMPKSWSADKQAIWDQAPQALKDLILSRENQVNEGFAKYQGIKPEIYKEMEAVLAPLDPMIQGYGTTRPEFVRQLASWHTALANNPNEAFPALARAYGFNITGSPAAIDPAQQPYVVNDPRVDQISQTVAGLQRQQEEIARREQESVMRQTSEKVAGWAKDKPHFDSVKFDMGLLIKASAEAGREMSLDEAYHKATWAHPEISNTLKKAEFEAQQKEARDKAEKSKLASVSVQTRSPASPALNGSQGGKLRDTIKEAMATVNGAGRA